MILSETYFGPTLGSLKVDAWDLVSWARVTRYLGVDLTLYALPWVWTWTNLKIEVMSGQGFKGFAYCCTFGKAACDARFETTNLNASPNLPSSKGTCFEADDLKSSKSSPYS